jgi:hypothetical protein
MTATSVADEPAGVVKAIERTHECGEFALTSRTITFQQASQ